MSKFNIKRIDRNNDKDYKLWIKKIEDFNGATIFHNPNFLSYHANRFDECHLGFYKGEQLFGMIPLAIINENNIQIAKSPYGASYGGFVFQSILNYSDSTEIISLFINYLKKTVNKIIITPSLSLHHNNGYSDTFSFSLLENGFKVVNSDITSTVSLSDKNIETEIFTSKIRNMARKARKAHVEIKYSCNIDDFWLLMDKTFQKHGTTPTHSKKQYQYLMNVFPDEIYCNIAYIRDIPVAGMGVFEINKKNIMSFYLCNDNEFQQTQAMSLLIYETILNAQERDFDFFDFGTSSVNMIGRENIFRFKESFGSVGSFKNTYEINLEEVKKYE